MGGEEIPVNDSDYDSNYTPDESGASDSSEDEYDDKEDETPPRRPSRQATPRQQENLSIEIWESQTSEGPLPFESSGKRHSR